MAPAGGADRKSIATFMTIKTPPFQPCHCLPKLQHQLFLKNIQVTVLVRKVREENRIKMETLEVGSSLSNELSKAAKVEEISTHYKTPMVESCPSSPKSQKPHPIGR